MPGGPSVAIHGRLAPASQSVACGATNVARRGSSRVIASVWTCSDEDYGAHFFYVAQP